MLDLANDPLDVSAIREDFPILSREVYGKRLVYLDNGASAQKPRQVLEAMGGFQRSEYANVHRGLHYLSNAATERFEAARKTVQRFLNATSDEEVIFTKNATEAINLVAYGLGMDEICAGDEIVLSIMEHHSNIVPWHFLRQRKGAVLKWAPVDDEGNFLLDAFEALLTEKTKLVAITQMSNVLGTIVPIKEVVRLAHQRGIKVLVDGSQGAVHLPVDVEDLGADFYVFTGHKLYGPTGIGVLWGRKELLNNLPPFLGGGEMIETVSTDQVTYGETPHRFEAGTPPITEAIGLAAAIDYLEGLGRARIYEHEASLTTYASEVLGQLPFLKIVGNAVGKGGIFSFLMDGVHAHDVSTLIDRSGVAVRAGTHCAEPLLARFGATSTCRASLGLYNDRDDINDLVVALEKASAFFN